MTDVLGELFQLGGLAGLALLLAVGGWQVIRLRHAAAYWEELAGVYRDRWHHELGRAAHYQRLWHEQLAAHEACCRRLARRHRPYDPGGGLPEVGEIDRGE